MWYMVHRVIERAGAGARPGATIVSAGHRGTAIGLVALVLVQAVIAGQSLFGGWTIDVHGWLGNASFVLGVLLVALAVRSRLGPALTLLAAGLVIAMFVQTGLGYAGRTSLVAASWHVPLGVTVFGLAVANAALLLAPQRQHASTGEVGAMAESGQSPRARVR